MIVADPSHIEQQFRRDHEWPGALRMTDTWCGLIFLIVVELVLAGLVQVLPKDPAGA
jgi:hypothetical protein